MICKKCGTENTRDSKFCINCGEPIASSDVSKENRLFKGDIRLFFIGMVIFIGIAVLGLFGWKVRSGIGRDAGTAASVKAESMQPQITERETTVVESKESPEESMVLESSSDIEEIKEVVRVEMQEFFESDKNFATYTGFTQDGESVWQIKSSVGEAAQLSHSGELGLFHDAYYYTDGGEIIKVEKNTGKELWRVGGQQIYGGIAVLDEANLLYVSGYFSDNMIIISPDGTVLDTKKFPQEYVRLSRMELRGKVLIFEFELKMVNGYEEYPAYLYLDLKSRNWLEKEGDIPYPE